MHVHRAGLQAIRDLGPDVPRLLEQLPTALGPAFALEQRHEQPELGRGQRYLVSVQSHLMRREIHAQRTRPEDAAAGRRTGVASPAQDRVDPQDQLTR